MREMPTSPQSPSLDIDALREFCRARGLEWPDENLFSSDWADRIIAIVASLAAEVAELKRSAAVSEPKR